MSEIIINNIELGDMGSESREKINRNSKVLKEAISNLDSIAVKKTDISQTLGTSTNKVPSEKAMSDTLADYPKKYEVVLGTILKGNKESATVIKAIASPIAGDTYKALDTGHYWTFDGAQWNDIGNILPDDLPQNIVTFSSDTVDIYPSNISKVLDGKAIDPESGQVVIHATQKTLDKVPLKPNTLYRVVVSEDIQNAWPYVFLYPSTGNTNFGGRIPKKNNRSWEFTTSTTDIYLSMVVYNGWDIRNKLSIFEIPSDKGDMFIGDKVVSIKNFDKLEQLPDNIVSYTKDSSTNTNIYPESKNYIVKGAINPDTGLMESQHTTQAVLNKVPLKPLTTYKVITVSNFYRDVYLYPSSSNVAAAVFVHNKTASTWEFTTDNINLFLSFSIKNSNSGGWDFSNNLIIYENYSPTNDVDEIVIIGDDRVSIKALLALNSTYKQKLLPLKDKKLVVYGTSIEAATPNYNNRDIYSYINVAVKALGGTVLNYAVDGGFLIKKTSQNSFTNLGAVRDYQKDMIDLIGTANEPDYFLFSFNVNDWAMGGNSQMRSENWDFSSEDVNNFIGAFNFVFKKLFTAKPKAKVILLTHFSDDKHPEGKDVFKDTNRTVKAIADYWQIPCIEMQKLCCIMNRNGVNNKIVYCPDGIHPGTSKTSVDYLARILVNQLPQYLAE